MKPRLFIVDPQLYNYQGHHFEYNQSVAAAAARAGLEPVILAHHSFQPAGDNGRFVRPTFRFKQGEFRPNAWRIDLARALLAASAREHDHVFVHTVYTFELEQFQALMALRPELAVPHWHFLFRYDMNQDNDFGRWALSRFFRWVENRVEFSKRIHFYTDTSALQAQFEPWAGREVRVLPVPHRTELLAACEKENTGGKLRVLYLGGARMEKGYHHLLNAVKHVKANTAPGVVNFVLQSNPDRPPGEAEVIAARGEMARMEGVLCPEGPFPPEEYYAMLAGADIVVLPYNAQRYRRRSSGALAEALAAGKVVVVPARTWMVEAAANAGHVAFESCHGLGAAIIETVNNFEALSEKSRKYAALYRLVETPDQLIEGLLRPAIAPVPSKALRRQALLLSDEWVFDPFSGSSRVGAAQIDALQAQGFAVTALCVQGPWVSAQPFADLQRRMRVEQFCRARGVKLYHAFLPSDWCFCPGNSIEGAAAQAVKHQNTDFETELFAHAAVRIDPAFLRLAQGMRFDVVLMNYAHNAPILDKILLKGARVICETHDIEAVSKALHRGDNIDHAEADAEIATLSKMQGVISISADERDYFAASLPANVPVVHLMPPLPAPQDPALQLAGCCNLAEITVAAVPDDPLRIRQIQPDLEARFGIDLLVVSSDSQLGRSSLVQFYREVFLPYLKPQGLRLTVAGGIGPPGEIPTSEHAVQFIGPFRDLGPIYAAARVIVLPVYTGTGTGIKTLEALRQGKAVVGTPMAFRGLGINVTELMIAETPDDFARQCKNLLADRHLRRRRAAQVAFLAADLPGAAQHSSGFATLLRQCLPGFRPLPVAVEEEAGPRLYFEADEGLLRFNVALRKVMLGGRPAVNDAHALLRELQSPEMRQQYARMFQAFAVDRTAPLAAGLSDTRFFTEGVRWSGSFDDFCAVVEATAHAAPSAEVVPLRRNAA